MNKKLKTEQGLTGWVGFLDDKPDWDDDFNFRTNRTEMYLTVYEKRREAKSRYSDVRKVRLVILKGR